MSSKSKNKTWDWRNIKTNMAKRLAKAKRQWKSENYIKDLDLALSKRK